MKNTASKSTATVTVPADIAGLIADRMREDLEHAAEQGADLRTKAHEVRKAGQRQELPEAAAVYFAEADRLDRRADGWDADFKALERICIALTRAVA